MKEKFVPNHLHLICKGTFNNPPKETTILNQWLTDLVNKVKMVVVAGPTSVYVDEPGNEGITGTVTLATSHAAIHIWDAETPSLFQFDLYSCSEFLTEDVIEHLNLFGIVEIEYLRIDRNDSLKITEHKMKKVVN